MEKDNLNEEQEKQIDQSILHAEEEFEKNGVLLDAREALEALRRKHFG